MIYVTYLYHGNRRCNFHRNYKTVHIFYKQHVKSVSLIYMKTCRFDMLSNRSICYQIRSDMGFINLLLTNLIGQILQPWYKLKCHYERMHQDVIHIKIYIILHVLQTRGISSKPSITVFSLFFWGSNFPFIRQP